MVGPSPSLGLAGRRISAFRVWGVAGLAAAVAVALGVCAARGLSLATETALIVASIVVFLTLAVVTKALTGIEQLIYYHHEIAVLGVAAALAAALGAPVLGHLDATALGLGAFLACGRVGCLSVGCCHGRPARHGVRYGTDHVHAGFPGYLAGITLVPVQAIEAAGAGALVIAGLTVIPTTPGAAFAFYVSGYAVLRFGLELERGDPERRYWRGLSEAQWTSLLVAVIVAALSLAGQLPQPALHVACAGVLLAAAPLATRRPRDLLDPRHVRELAHLLPAPGDHGDPRVATTSLGLQLSAGATDGAIHFTLTRADGGLREEEVAGLARVVQWLTGRERPPQILSGSSGAVHLVFARTEPAS
ncbi:MAG: prolipoprotein diacylglyceryl transferase family protein [Solirubrobacteraceae bacterium]